MSIWNHVDIFLAGSNELLVTRFSFTEEEKSWQEYLARKPKMVCKAQFPHKIGICAIFFFIFQIYLVCLVNSNVSIVGFNSEHAKIPM